MPNDIDLQFLQSIKEIFDPVFKDYGFELQGESVWNGHGEYLVIATHGDITLDFYLTVIPLSSVRYCSLGIKLSGKLAKKATANKHYHSVDVMVIAKVLDPDFQHPSMEIRTGQELKEILQKEKECLLKYCKDILSGDVSKWQKVVKYLEEELKKSGIKIEGRD